MRQTKNWINSNSIEVFLHGLIMGTINKLPGISGGLYAIVIGFYSDLMLSIKKINKESLIDLLTFRLSLFSDKINGRFLLYRLFFTGAVNGRTSEVGCLSSVDVRDK